MSAPDPFEPLTVAQAARLAGVPKGQVQARIDAGELLHERGASGDVIVRRVDLAHLWPAVLPAAGASAPAQAETPDVEPVSKGAGTQEEASPAEGSEDGRAEEAAHLARQKHAFEVRLASMQSSNEALSSQVRDLQLQRTDLKEQCTDLRGRMTLVEKERQASTAGLLLAQRRLLELEAAGGPRGSDWWRRPTTWGFASVTLLLGVAWAGQWTATRTAQGAAAEHAASLEAELEEQAGERAAWREASDGLLEELGAQRAARQAERSQLEVQLASRDQELALARQAAEESRVRFTERLEASLEATAAVRQTLLEQQAAGEAALEAQAAAGLEALEVAGRAAAEERARFEAALGERERLAAEREASLRQELAAAREASEGLTQELSGVLAEQAELDVERGQRLDEVLAKLAELERRQRGQEARRALEQVLRALWPGR